MSFSSGPVGAGFSLRAPVVTRPALFTVGSAERTHGVMRTWRTIPARANLACATDECPASERAGHGGCDHVKTAESMMANAVSAERLLAHLQWFSGVRRDTGGPGEARAAEYIADRLRAGGVPVTVHEFDAFLSYPVRATLEVLAPEQLQIACLTHSFGRPTGAQGVVSDLLALEDGNVNRGAGRACLIDGLATPVTILRASRAGCAAVIFANQDQVIHNMIGTTVWGTPALDQVDRLPQLPVVSVNKAGGETLRRLLAGGQRVTVRVTTDVKTGWVRSELPEARIPGGGGTSEFALVGAHYCSWDVGITDNATGDVCLLEMARILWDHRADLRRNVRICWWPGHSHGRYSGSTWYADTYFADLAEHCLAYHNIDSPGVRGATRYVARHTTAEVQQFCREVIRRVTGQRDVPVHRPSRAADQSFLANGVPSFSTYPFLPDDHPDRRPWTGGSANAWWWHTEFDTLDKADPEILALDTRVSLTAVAELANAEILPFNHVDTGREIRECVSQLATAVGSHLDLLPAITAADAFLTSAAKLEVLKARADGRRAARRINEALRRLSRILTPVIYSQSGRFAHDPAEWSPIMRAVGQYTLPGLSRAAALPQLAGDLDYGFLRAQAVRERNRVVTALGEATRLAEETVEAITRG
ncbi:MAG TPA: M28 family peptidase [bacterium]|nr:M28 family peptidase [bacterium]